MNTRDCWPWGTRGSPDPEGRSPSTRRVPPGLGRVPVLRTAGKRKRVEVPVPDVRARVAAIELLLREGLGRPAQAEEKPVPHLPATVAEAKALSWDDLRALPVIHEPDLIHLEIASLTKEQRSVLREALAESAHRVGRVATCGGADPNERWRDLTPI